MKKLKFYLGICVCLVLFSCASKPYMIGRNTINTVGLEQLNLVRADYQILKTVTATAVLTCKVTSSGLKITEQNDEFELLVSGSVATVTKGILKFGYLTNDIGTTSALQSTTGLVKQSQIASYIPSDPETIARQLAKYRLINEAKALEGDGVIEPLISSDITQTEKGVTVIKTTLTAKVIVLKTDK